MTTMATNILDISCSVCQRSFKTFLALSSHQKAKSHIGLDYSCLVCGSYYTTLNKLQYHQECTKHKDVYDCTTCEVCGRNFTTMNGCLAHTAAKHAAFVCSVPGCSRRFSTMQGCHSHQDVKKHWQCYAPKCYFRTKTKELLRAHGKATDHVDRVYEGKEDGYFPCQIAECELNFTTSDEKFRHLVEDHPYCQKCRKPFISERLLENHLSNAAPHVDEIRCLECDTSFSSVADLERHGNHCKPKKINHHCTECDKTFPTSSALAKHKASLVHKPISNNLTCLGGCGKTFSAPSALVMHLESGGCTGDIGSAIDKKVLDRAVFENDTDGIICHGAVPEAIMTPSSTYDSGFSTPGGAPIFTPSSTSGSVTGIATPGSSTNTMRLVTLPKNPLCCPLCPRNRPAFVNPRALEQHIQSSAHAPKIYHCPEFLLNGMKIKLSAHMKFRNLSGLAQHLEAGACGGRGKKGKRIFKKVMSFVEAKLRDMGLGEVNLIG